LYHVFDNCGTKKDSRLTIAELYVSFCVYMFVTKYIYYIYVKLINCKKINIIDNTTV